MTVLVLLEPVQELGSGSSSSSSTTTTTTTIITSIIVSIMFMYYTSIICLAPGPGSGTCARCP